MRKKLMVSSLLISALLTSCGNTTTNTIHDISKYGEYVYRCSDSIKSFMPSLGSLSDYKERSVSLTSSSHEYGGSDTEPYGLILFVSYEEDIFEIKKEEIEQNYSFVESSIVDKYGDNLMPAIDVMYCDYRIRVVYDEDFWYPKYFGMIGINEDKYTIAYLCYQNIEIDVIGFKGDPIEKQIDSFIKTILFLHFVFPE